MAKDDTILQVDVLEPDTPPSEQTALFNRKSLLLGPDWRYQDAVSYLAAEREGKSSVLPSDPLVQYTIRAVRAFNNVDSRSYMMQLWPDMAAVLYYGTIASPSAVVAEMETFLLHGKTTKDVINAGLPCGPDIYELYGKIFFDLTGALAVHSWINDYLFEPERRKNNTGLLRSRLLAFYGSTDSGIKASITAASSTDTDALMKKLMNNERSKKLFDYVIKVGDIDGIEYAMIMEAALKGVTDKEFAEHMRDRDDAGTGSLEELAADLHAGVRAFSAYEMDKTNETGLDFVNQYTSVILNKDKNTNE